MASIRMCGVVLWSSQEDGRAVIWCEDHGKLAFYARGTAPHPTNDLHRGVSLDAGDLIEFEVEDQHDKRRAHNPRLLVADHAPCIATELRQEADPLAPPPLTSLDHAFSDAHSADIVPFRPSVTPDRARAAG